MRCGHRSSRRRRATERGAATINVTWNRSVPAGTYWLIRRHDGAEDSIAVSGSSYADTSPVSGATYAYRLVALADSRVSSNVDIATTMSFTNVTSGRTVSLSDYTQVLNALNAVRKAVGWPAVTWSTIMPPSVEVPSTGRAVRAIHLTALRLRMEEALHALGVAVGGYTDPDPFHLLIKATYLQELQQRVQ